MKKKLNNAIELITKNLELSKDEASLLDGLKSKVAQMVAPEPKASTMSEHKALAEGLFELVVYSDGACRGNPGPGSYGLYVEELGNSPYEKSEFFKHTTNNKMELLGIIEGLKYSIAKGMTEVLVVTDSKYAINGMQSWMAGWKSRGWKKADKKPPENVEMWQELDQLKDSFKKLDFEWVKGHSGHPQNERCDQLANMALDAAGC